MSSLPDAKFCVRRVSFQVFMESLMIILVLWGTTPCSLVPYNSLHAVITQRPGLLEKNAVKLSNTCNGTMIRVYCSLK